ncbi:MAG: response regulator [Nitrospirae bacterium]|nr:response regulator [Nitrospirota bacterium]
MIWVLTQDLFYYSKLRSVAEKQGMAIVRVPSLSALPKGPPPQLAVLDLGCFTSNDSDPVTRLRASSGRPDLPVVAFFSHVQTEQKKKAKEQGCGEVLPKSAFADRFAEIVSRYFPPSVPAP